MAYAEDVMCTLCSVWKAIFKALLLSFKFLYALEFLSFPSKFYFVVFGHIHRIVKSDYLFHYVCPSAWNNSASAGQIFMEFDIWVFFENW